MSVRQTVGCATNITAGSQGSGRVGLPVVIGPDMGCNAPPAIVKASTQLRNGQATCFLLRTYQLSHEHFISRDKERELL